MSKQEMNSLMSSLPRDIEEHIAEIERQMWVAFVQKHTQQKVSTTDEAKAIVRLTIAADYNELAYRRLLGTPSMFYRQHADLMANLETTECRDVVDYARGIIRACEATYVNGKLDIERYALLYRASCECSEFFRDYLKIFAPCYCYEQHAYGSDNGEWY